MRILICSFTPPLSPVLTGHGVQVSALWEQLRQRHEVRVLAFRRPVDSGRLPHGVRLVEPPAVPEGPAAGLRFRARSWALGRPSGVDAACDLLREPLLEEVADFDPDVVHVTAGTLASLARHLGDRPAVLAALDAEFLNLRAAMATSRSSARRQVWRLEAALMRRFERREYLRFGRVVVVTERDAEALRALEVSMPVTVIPNGVDAAAYAPVGQREPGLIVFSGTMNHPPNVTAAVHLAHDVLPRVRAAVPGAHVALVGRDPVRAVDALRKLEGVTVTGPVAAMAPWLSRATAYACPMLTGTGIKNKLLEAMANGVPCAATSLAAAGLGTEPGEHLLIGDDPDELAHHLITLLTDDVTASRVASAASDLVARRLSWRAVADAYDAVYREVAGIAR